MGRQPVAKTRIEKILKGEAIPPVEDIDFFLGGRLEEIYNRLPTSPSSEDEGKAWTADAFGNGSWKEAGVAPIACETARVIGSGFSYNTFPSTDLAFRDILSSMHNDYEKYGSGAKGASIVANNLKAYCGVVGAGKVHYQRVGVEDIIYINFDGNICLASYNDYWFSAYYHRSMQYNLTTQSFLDTGYYLRYTSNDDVNNVPLSEFAYYEYDRLTGNSMDKWYTAFDFIYYPCSMREE